MPPTQHSAALRAGLSLCRPCHTPRAKPARDGSVAAGWGVRTAGRTSFPNRVQNPRLSPEAGANLGHPAPS